MAAPVAAQGEALSAAPVVAPVAAQVAALAAEQAAVVLSAMRTVPTSSRMKMSQLSSSMLIRRVFMLAVLLRC